MWFNIELLNIICKLGLKKVLIVYELKYCFCLSIEVCLVNYLIFK